MPKKLRLLLITNLFPTPVDPVRGIFIYQLVQELKSLCDITIVCPLPWFPRIKSLYFIKKWYDFSLVPKSYFVNGVKVYSPKYLIIPRVSETVHSVLMFLGVIKTVLNLNRQGRFDTINVQWLYPDGVVAYWVARILRLPLSVSGLGCDVNLFLEQKQKKLQIVNMLKHVDVITVVSESMKRRLLEEGVQEQKISIIPNGVNARVFRLRDKAACRQKLALPREGKIVLFVGRLLEIKGVSYLIEAARLLAEMQREFTLYLVGEGAQRQRYEDAVTEHHLRDHVRFVGSKGHHEIGLWMGACDVFCLPSLQEGCPNVVLEALSCGRPVVASRVGGIPDMVCEKSGVLVEPEDSHALCEVLDLALHQEWEPSEIHRSVAHLSWEAAAEQYYRAIHATLTQQERKFPDEQRDTTKRCGKRTKAAYPHG
jgi:teichuronic acid biosynthesis glycosyltransferase TuaC